VAERVERVYDDIHEKPSLTILGRIKNSLSLGLFAGVGSAFMMILELFMMIFWIWIDPEDTIEKSVDFNYAKYMKDKEIYGDHTFKVNETKMN
jgi:hypothetical protein